MFGFIGDVYDLGVGFRFDVGLLLGLDYFSVIELGSSTS